MLCLIDELVMKVMCIAYIQMLNVIVYKLVSDCRVVFVNNFAFGPLVDHQVIFDVVFLRQQTLINCRLNIVRCFCVVGI